MASLPDSYAARPAALDSMCLAEFVMWYQVSQNKQREESSDFISTVDKSQEAESVTVALANNLGTMTKKVKPI